MVPIRMQPSRVRVPLMAIAYAPRFSAFRDRSCHACNPHSTAAKMIISPESRIVSRRSPPGSVFRNQDEKLAMYASITCDGGVSDGKKPQKRMTAHHPANVSCRSLTHLAAEKC